MRAIPGVVTGLVKGLDDPDGQGRIQVEFTSLEEGQRSSWAPVAVPLAGQNRGMFFHPELEDGVLLAFEQGDFDHPFIVGFLWDGVHTPPETTNQNRVIVTPGGHTLRFEDTDGSRKIVLKSSTGHQITLDDSGAGSITVQTKSGSLSIKLNEEKQSVQIEGGGRILAMADGQVQIS